MVNGISCEQNLWVGLPYALEPDTRPSNLQQEAIMCRSLLSIAATVALLAATCVRAQA